MGKRSVLKLPSKLLIIAAILCLTSSITSCTCAGGRVTASLLLSSEEAMPGEQFEVQVEVRPGKQGISAVEINLAFDSQAMQVLDTRPGELLGEAPLPGILKIDNEAGTLNYSLARIGETRAPTPVAVFAIITFQILESAKAGDYEFSLTNVGLASQNFEDISDIQIKGASIKVRA